MPKPLAGCCCPRKRTAARSVCSRRWWPPGGKSAMGCATLPHWPTSRCSESRSVLARRPLRLDSLHGNTAEAPVRCGSSPNRLLPFDSHPNHSSGPESLKRRKGSPRRRCSCRSKYQVPSKPCWKRLSFFLETVHSILRRRCFPRIPLCLVQRQGIFSGSYLLIRAVEVSHGGKPSIVDRIGEDRPSLLLVGPFECCSS